MNTPENDRVETFVQEAFLHLQFLREYAGILQDPYPVPEVLDSLSQEAHSLATGGDEHGYPLLAEVAWKLDHIFQYVRNGSIVGEASSPLLEFIAEAVAILESDLLMISTNSTEATEDLDAFRQRYPAAFQAAPAEELPEASPPEATVKFEETTAGGSAPPREPLPPDAEISEEILEFFIPEAEEHFQTITECLLSLETNPNQEEIQRLFRAMHTVKGSAAQVGLQRIAHVAHRAEDLIGRLRDGLGRPSTEIVDACLEAVDVLKRLLYHRWPDEQLVQDSIGSLLARMEALALESGNGEPETTSLKSDDASEQESDAHSSLAEAPTLPAAAIPPATEPEQADAGPPTWQGSEIPRLLGVNELAGTPQSKSVRIPLNLLDRMMNAVGELVINRTRMIGRLGELERLTEVLNFSKARLADKIGEFQGKYEFTPLRSCSPAFRSMARGPEVGAGASNTFYQTSASEFSELELDRYDDFNILSRSLTEISADITEVLTELHRFVTHVDSELDDFSKLAHRLQDEITQARMVPIGNLFMRISRTARDAAKAAAKQVELSLSGTETELDNGIIQQISDPLIHLVRNAIAHGIESPKERAAKGKPAIGRLDVRAFQRGNQICIEVEDDGRGIEYERVRTTAVENGFVSVDEAGGLTEQQLLELLFRPGFSTASHKTELAGRGVGLDVVRSNLDGLNGEISVETNPGAGTRFMLKVPLTLIITQALFLRSRGSIFAIPLTCVEEIRRVPVAALEEIGGQLITRVRDVDTEVVRLDAQLGLEACEPTNGFYRMVIVSVNGRQVGLLVEEVLRKDEIVIKSLGEYLRGVRLFSGATIAPDGSLILLLDVNRLVAGETREQRLVQSAANTSVALSPPRPVAAGGNGSHPEAKGILLVDDSISIRRFLSRMLEKAGYAVKCACDGLEALETVSQSRFDLVLTDLEMPRTTGYELMAHLRQNTATRQIPVLVMTSRAGTKHREKALREGASGFLTKPVQEDQLLATVYKILGIPRVGDGAAASGDAA